MPHQHHSEASSEPVISACVHSENNLLGFLAKVFHLDLGGEHLENFKPAHKADLMLSVPIVADIVIWQFTLIEVIDDESHQLPHLTFRSYQIFPSQTPLRGPPPFQL